MDQSPQPGQLVMGMVTAGPAQMPYPVPTYSPASIVTGAPAVIGTHPSATQASINPAVLPTGGAQHHNQLAFQQVQQFHQQQQQHQQQQLQASLSELLFCASSLIIAVAFMPNMVQ
jgi:nuclear transcription factor Y, gamma